MLIAYQLHIHTGNQRLPSSTKATTILASKLNAHRTRSAMITGGFCYSALTISAGTRAEVPVSRRRQPRHTYGVPNCSLVDCLEQLRIFVQQDRRHAYLQFIYAASPYE
jgi:hypothetical protein